MTKYKVSIVKRESEGAKCTDVLSEKWFIKLSRIQYYVMQEMKRGRKPWEIDVTVYKAFGFSGEADYAGTLDTITLKDKGY